MTELNDRASAAAVSAGVRCATDVTGFGLLGHLYKLVRTGVALSAREAAALPAQRAARVGNQHRAFSAGFSDALHERRGKHQLGRRRRGRGASITCRRSIRTSRSTAARARYRMTIAIQLKITMARGADMVARPLQAAFQATSIPLTQSSRAAVPSPPFWSNRTLAAPFAPATIYR